MWFVGTQASRLSKRDSDSEEQEYCHGSDRQQYDNPGWLIGCCLPITDAGSDGNGGRDILGQKHVQGHFVDVIVLAHI